MQKIRNYYFLTTTMQEKTTLKQNVKWQLKT